MSSSPNKNNSLDSPLRRALEQPPLKRFRMASRTAEAGTLTEPESLGPCEPGTTINLDGIVWNETKGGMLSLNITWRGKSYMGTLIDCSVTDHGSEWAAPWSADTEAPDQRTRYLRKKKNKKKKKRKKVADDTSAANISNESIEEDKTEPIEEGKPITLISCTSGNCEKKFTSESALKYHVTFAHEKIKTVSSNCSDKNVSNNVVMSDDQTTNDPQTNQDKNSLDTDIKPAVPSEGQLLNQGVPQESATAPATALIKTEKDKLKSKVFPSTQNIRPILPAQSPQISGLALKPIQPKPAILPPPTKNLNLDTLKKPLLNKSPSVKCEQSSEREEVTAIDLSTGNVKSPGHNSNGTIMAQEVDKKPSIADLNIKPILNINTTSSSSSPSLTITSSASPPKARTPIISVKSEFNTGNKQKSLSDGFDKDELEVLKHISKPTSGVTPTFPSLTTSSYSPFPPPPPVSEYLGSPGGYLPPSLSMGLPPGYMIPPPSSTASHLLPGLMGLPPPPATPLSPFGASLESLARAAEERARSYGGNFSPGHIPVSGFNHSPGAGAHAAPRSSGPGPGVPNGQGSTGGPGGGVTNGGPPATTESGDPPLLRHEHMHTHLHYITSPTHGQ